MERHVISSATCPIDLRSNTTPPRRPSLPDTAEALSAELGSTTSSRRTSELYWCLESARRPSRRSISFSEKYHLEGWGYRRIATELNAQGVPAARGKNWSLTAVNQILHNPTYLGLGIANRNSAGIYSVRSPNQPKPSHVDERTLATSKVSPSAEAPASDVEWFERHEEGT